MQWVSDGSPTHSSTPFKIDSALQFVPKNTNPKEFKQLQQQVSENRTLSTKFDVRPSMSLKLFKNKCPQIKDYRRAEKISAGPQSHILEGVSWEEAKKMQVRLYDFISQLCPCMSFYFY